MTWRARLGLMIAAATALIGLGVPPASAAGELGLSPDGVTWGDALPGPLFDPALRWVPGDSEVRTFYVRNQSSDDGVLDVTLLTGPVESLIDTGDLSISAKVGNGDYTSAATAGDHQLVKQVVVAAGAVRKLSVKVDFDPASTNSSQQLRLDFRFKVSLSQDTTAVQPPSNGGGGNNNGNGGHGDLPGTGTVVTPTMLLLGALLVAAGTGLIGYSRRRVTRLEERPSHAQA
ncbi:LPXTG cell wall anchor domain-containing protein [Nocardioides marmorisolisilvae]|uniref:LPXTG cell wall anchor domain-containing protein n=1 Tax=Nocardioides marmorisolisilvae TaxID=1542737 RepID=A0A3N0DU89_9ACTN|nr:LPXTG cell wall anchor domain-containing protein [Nocardioides marmorisolisilvae]RNL79192.1 LPXTG cell wall anchor domain-containing protein [Nocardioides marmorisolisilvae]